MHVVTIRGCPAGIALGRQIVPQVEALARGLGWHTNASMRAALAAAPAEVRPYENVFLG